MHDVEYAKMAQVEDAMWYYRALHGHVAQALTDLPEDAAVLDAGCGTGGLLRGLARRHPGWRLAGLDFSALACAFARERVKAEIVEGSVLALPFESGRFAAITSCDVLCQVEAPDAALREFHRCLRPGGRVVLTMPAFSWMYSYHDRQVGNLRRYSRAETWALLRGAGFRPAAGTYWNTLPFPLAVLRRKLLPAAEGASDVHLYPAPVEASFRAMMSMELAWVRAGGRLPWGSSVLAVGVKENA